MNTTPTRNNGTYIAHIEDALNRLQQAREINMQVLVALVACLAISSAFLLPPVPSSRPPHALKGDGKLVDFDGLDKVSLRPAKQVGRWEYDWGSVRASSFQVQ